MNKPPVSFSSSFTAIGTFAWVRCGAAICPELGVKRTRNRSPHSVAVDPKRASLWLPIGTASNGQTLLYHLVSASTVGGIVKPRAFPVLKYRRPEGNIVGLLLHRFHQNKIETFAA